MGDWSIGKQMKNFISTPNLGLKRKLIEHYNVYNLDEFRTSLLNYKTNKNVKIYIYQIKNKQSESYIQF